MTRLVWWLMGITTAMLDAIDQAITEEAARR